MNEIGKIDEKAMLVVETIEISKYQNISQNRTVGSEPLQVTGKIKDLKIFNISHIGDIGGIFQQ